MDDRPSIHPDARRLTLEHLRAFVCIAEDGGFQRASQELHRSQSAVSQSLQKLEDILGCRLLERRQGHVLGLTVAGERLLPLAREVLARISDAVATLRRPELSGRIALGVPDDFPLVDIIEAVSRCLKVNRNLRVEVTSAQSSQILRLLGEGRLDLGIFKTMLPVGAVGIGRERSLRTEALCWVGARGHAPGAHAELPLVGFPDGCAHRAAALAALGRIGRAAYFAYVSASYANIRNAIASGLGFGVLPEDAVGRDLAVLGSADGLPDLPPVRLTMITASTGSLYEQFGEILVGPAAEVAAVTVGGAITPRPAPVS